MKTWLYFGAAIVSIASSAQAQTNNPDPLQVRSWAASCSNCHGTNGRAEAGNEALAGANKDDIVKKMMDFKAGRKPAISWPRATAKSKLLPSRVTLLHRKNKELS
jgi:cytochrome c553